MKNNLRDLNCYHLPECVNQLLTELRANLWSDI